MSFLFNYSIPLSQCSIILMVSSESLSIKAAYSGLGLLTYSSGGVSSISNSLGQSFPVTKSLLFTWS
jgi:hypothetical protein